MNDLVSRQAIDALCKAGCGCGYCGISCEDIAVIEGLPIADVRENVHGKWIKREED